MRLDSEIKDVSVLFHKIVDVVTYFQIRRSSTALANEVHTLFTSGWHIL